MLGKTMAFLTWTVELILNTISKLVAGLIVTFLIIAVMLATVLTFVIYLVQ